MFLSLQLVACRQEDEKDEKGEKGEKGYVVYIFPGNIRFVETKDSSDANNKKNFITIIFHGHFHLPLKMHFGTNTNKN
ncbi:hypothetical protein [Segetibacter sp.]|uniref:hypothetical protein n=1 Tax=Segetibacter sp. TaxID=2231182 RepID=UPI00261374AC|nr:hypothetical protein [Segetibacter sp.]MCW3080578.1 hypothetical protein [Segetibacter sp.]